VAASFGLLLIALRRWDGPAAGLRWLDPVRACGRRSYSIYLAHLPACVVADLALYDLGLTGFWARALVTVPLASALGVATGWVFYALVEAHFVNSPPARPAGGSGRGRTWLSGVFPRLNLPSPGAGATEG
jgi:peptidoglycan/LPS O-acetylase OafA/YrhL